MAHTRESRDSYDVVVIGGGPAGTTLATFCQRLGHRCLVLERSTFPRYHIGESLIPHTYDTLDRLGLLPALKASSFPKKHSVRFVGESGRESDPFYFSETIPGERSQTWQVERSQFDQMCLDHARKNGVDVLMETKVDRVLFDHDRATGVRVQTPDGQRRQIASRVVVDASGRATVIGSQLGLKDAVPGLHKTSIWSYYRGGKRLEGIDAGETTVFMIPNRGWFWYIPLPDDVVGVGVVASPDDLFTDSKDYQEVFLGQVDACRPLKARLVDAQRFGPVRGIPTLAYRNRRIAGEGWMMIGDAAAFLDPIYSSGLFLALASAELAAPCVHDALQADDLSAQRLGAFGTPLMRGVEVIRQLIDAFYDPKFSFGEFVQRFPEQRAALIDCLIGDVIDKDMSSFTNALAQMTPAHGREQTVQ
ncbi:MAG: NAD(P)/FAD-dependent oxidoreductase [Phycisphaeraceae bacterium]|jgi:flavin-dependent dehydrogenase|nr:NAD(P)/FAD-dependent oxidoreductase [Phycisphaeraceae bacterium]